jgi:hypothetical protein
VDSSILDFHSGWRWLVSFTPWPLCPWGKSSQYPTGWEAVWAQETVWTTWRREKSCPYWHLIDKHAMIFNSELNITPNQDLLLCSFIKIGPHAPPPHIHTHTHTQIYSWLHFEDTFNYCQRSIRMAFTQCRNSHNVIISKFNSCIKKINFNIG